MKAALWFLTKFLIFSLLVSVLYWQNVGSVNEVFVSLVNRGWTIVDVTYELAPNREKIGNIQIFRVAGDVRQLFAEFDGRPFHFNLAPLLALFLATPSIRLRQKVFYTFCGVLLLIPTWWFHIYTNLIEISSINLPLRNWSVSIIIGDFSRWFLYQGLRYGSIFMKQTGTVFVPFLIWLVFFFNRLKFLFYPEERILAEIEANNRQA